MENRLWYKSEARAFEEALPIGNGKLGAMVYGGSVREKLSVNIDELWSGVPGENKREGAYDAYKKACELAGKDRMQEAQHVIDDGFTCYWDDMYLPMADLYIDGLSVSGEYRRELDLCNAVATVTHGSAKRTYFCSKPQNALYIKIENEPEMEISVQSKLKTEAVYAADSISLTGECPDSRIIPEESPDGKGVPYYGGRGLKFCVSAKIETDGTVRAGDSVKISGATYVTVRLSACTSYKNGMDAAHLLESIHMEDAVNFEEAYREHTADFSALYNRVRLELGHKESDKDTYERLKSGDDHVGLTELMFNYGRYLIISASREGSEAMNLQGIWNEKLFAPWNSNYTLNINFEMNYWPVLMCNLPECYKPMIEFIKKICEMGKRTARDMYGAHGFASHHNADLWGKTAPVGNRHEGTGRYAYWNGSVGWLSAALYEYYEYTCDEDYLRNVAYPIIKEGVMFYMDILTEHEGKYIISPSTSPENLYVLDGKKMYLAKWTTMTQTIVYELFGIFLHCAQLLSADAELAEKVRSIAPDVKIFNTGSRGQMLEWDKEYEESDPHHRHVSHLYGLFPGRSITTDTTPELAEACKKTLTERSDAGPGWSASWKANLWAKLKDGDHAFRVIERQLEYVDINDNVSWEHGGTYMNMFDAHPPFQIDGNFGITAAVVQLLLQCENGKIKLLPALPDKMPSGSVDGICAKGGVTVGMTWDHATVREIRLTSKIKQTVELVVNGREYAYELEAGAEKIIANI